jgi:hypothetical protein
MNSPPGSHSDDAVRKLLLAMISTTRPASDDQLASLSASDWMLLNRMAGQHRLRPLLHHQLRTSAAGWPVPDTLKAEWADAFRRASIRSLRARAVLLRLQPILDGAGYSWAALKGAWLAQQAYDLPALRPVRDIDILIAPETALEAFRLLEQSGFEQIFEKVTPPEHWLTFARHLPPLRCTLTGVLVEIHTCLTRTRHERDTDSSLSSIPDLLSRKIIIDSIPYLSIEDNLIHIIIHSFYDHQMDNGPLIINDVANITLNYTVDWSAFWRMAHEGSWLPGCLVILELVSRYHRIDVWRQHAGIVPGPMDRELDAAELLSLQDLTSRDRLIFHSQMAEARSWLAKAYIILTRAYPARHALAEFAGNTSSSWVAMAHYPRWLAATATQLFFQPASQSLMQDVERVIHIRKWADTTSARNTARSFRQEALQDG